MWKVPPIQYHLAQLPHVTLQNHLPGFFSNPTSFLQILWKHAFPPGPQEAVHCFPTSAATADPPWGICAHPASLGLALDPLGHQLGPPFRSTLEMAELDFTLFQLGFPLRGVCFGAQLFVRVSDECVASRCQGRAPSRSDLLLAHCWA